MPNSRQISIMDDVKDVRQNVEDSSYKFYYKNSKRKIVPVEDLEANKSNREIGL